MYCKNCGAYMEGLSHCPNCGMEGGNVNLDPTKSVPPASSKPIIDGQETKKEKKQEKNNQESNHVSYKDINYKNLSQISEISEHKDIPFKEKKQKKNLKKPIVILITVLLIILVGILGYFAYDNLKDSFNNLFKGGSSGKVLECQRKYPHFDYTYTVTYKNGEISSLEYNFLVTDRKDQNMTDEEKKIVYEMEYFSNYCEKYKGKKGFIYQLDNEKGIFKFKVDINEASYEDAKLFKEDYKDKSQDSIKDDGEKQGYTCKYK